MRLTLVQLRNAILFSACVLLAGGIGWWLGQNDIKLKEKNQGQLPSISVTNRAAPAAKQDVDFSLFWEVWDRLEQDFLFRERINQQKMVYGAIAGMTAALDDPYTAFFPPQENRTAKENLNGSFGGVGIQLGYKKFDGINQLAVISPLSGMPAEKAGVKAGDYILRIKDQAKGIDKDTSGLSLPEAVELIRGEAGTSVELTIYTKDDPQERVVTLARDTVVVPSAEVEFGEVKDGKWQKTDQGSVAWLKLTRFGGMTDEQWDKAIQEIVNHSPQARGVVLDLRNNPGGYLEGAVTLGGEFLPKGTVVVKQEHTKYPTQEYPVERIGRLITTPLVVLVNQGSASASEIMAGALRDHDRAKLVGETTFGKGTIQEAEDLRDGAGLHVTVARWLTPKGTWVHEQGLKPDVEIKNDPDKPEEDRQLVEAAKLLL
jgi:carboxyl-terminal processing protease